jgi:hypothetical protein
MGFCQAKQRFWHLPIQAAVTKYAQIHCNIVCMQFQRNSSILQVYYMLS